MHFKCISDRKQRPGEPEFLCMSTAAAVQVAEFLDATGFWQDRLGKLRDRTRSFGTVFATKREDINRLAEARGVRKLSNLNGCPS